MCSSSLGLLPILASIAPRQAPRALPRSATRRVRLVFVLRRHIGHSSCVSACTGPRDRTRDRRAPSSGRPPLQGPGFRGRPGDWPPSPPGRSESSRYGSGLERRNLTSITTAKPIAHPCKSAIRTIILAFTAPRSRRADPARKQRKRQGTVSHHRPRAPERSAASGYRRKEAATRLRGADTKRTSPLQSSRPESATPRAFMAGPQKAARATIDDAARHSPDARGPTTAGLGDCVGHPRGRFPNHAQPRQCRTLAPYP